MDNYTLIPSVIFLLVLSIVDIYLFVPGNELTLPNERNLIKWSDAVWNKRNGSVIDISTDDKLMIYGVTQNPMNKDAYKKWWNETMSKVEDLKVVLTHTMSPSIHSERANWVAVRGIVTGTLKTGMKFHFNGGGFLKFHNGRIIESYETWNVPDELL